MSPEPTNQRRAGPIKRDPRWLVSPGCSHARAVQARGLASPFGQTERRTWLGRPDRPPARGGSGACWISASTGGHFAECDRERGRGGVTAKPRNHPRFRARPTPMALPDSDNLSHAGPAGDDVDRQGRSSASARTAPRRTLGPPRRRRVAASAPRAEARSVQLGQPRLQPIRECGSEDIHRSRR